MGVITYFLLAGYTPFDRDSQQQEMEAIIAGDYKFEPEEYWAHVSDTARDFVRECLTIDPASRPTAAQALKHKVCTIHTTIMQVSHVFSSGWLTRRPTSSPILPARAVVRQICCHSSRGRSVLNNCGARPRLASPRSTACRHSRETILTPKPKSCRTMSGCTRRRVPKRLWKTPRSCTTTRIVPPARFVIR